MAPSVFPLPRASFKILCKIIGALAEQKQDTKNVSLHQLASSGKMDLADVARNMKFLVAAGIIASPKSKKLTPLGHQLSLAIRGGEASAIRNAWRKIVLDSGYLKGIVDWIEQSGPQDAEKLLAKVTQSARAKLDDRTKTGRKAVLEILVQAGLLEVDAHKNYRVVGTSVGAPTGRATKSVRAAAVEAAPLLARENKSLTELEIAIHLPATKDPEIYEMIFRLIKKHFGK